MLPATASLLSRRNGVPIATARLDAQFGYVFSGFDDFLACYDEVGRVVKRGRDLSELAANYLRAVAAEGTIYVEFMVSPDHSIDNGIPYLEQIDAIAEGIRSAEASADISAAIIITCVRHRGPEAARRLAEVVTANPHPLVVGFGMTGDENSYETQDFAGAFSLAKDAGLGLTAHAGEWRSAETVVEAVEVLGLSRVGHGVAVAESDDAIRTLAAKRVGYEICISSNVLLGAVPHRSMHPFITMMRKGCQITLATDDPAFFGTSPLREMEIAQTLGATRGDLVATVRNGIEMSFASKSVRANLLRKISTLT
jgi:adenosine deaminase